MDRDWAGTARSYLYTIWVDKIHDVCPDLQAALQAHVPSTIKYVVWQRERCPETQKIHFQLFLEFKQPQRGGKLSGLLGFPRGSLWFARARSRSSARDYCRKEDSRIDGPYELGTWTEEGGGRRTDLEQAASAIISGRKRLADIAREQPSTFVKFHRGLGALQAATARPVWGRQQRKVYICWGATSTGKTSWAYAGTQPWFQSVWRCPLPTSSREKPWFNGIENEPWKCALFDDFYGQISYPFILQLCDGWPVSVESKYGGFHPWTVSYIVFTSNVHYTAWWSQLDFSAFKARLTACFEFREDGAIVEEDLGEVQRRRQGDADRPAAGDQTSRGHEVTRVIENPSDLPNPEASATVSLPMDSPQSPEWI